MYCYVGRTVKYLLLQRVKYNINYYMRQTIKHLFLHEHKVLHGGSISIYQYIDLFDI